MINITNNFNPIYLFLWSTHGDIIAHGSIPALVGLNIFCHSGEVKAILASEGNVSYNELVEAFQTINAESYHKMALVKYMWSGEMKSAYIKRILHMGRILIVGA